MTMPAQKAHSGQYPFLQGGGETADLIRTLDWSNNPLGAIEQWPVSLRTTLGILLHSAFPTLLLWGEELICFYNDAFIPSLGSNGKHPSIGKKGSEMWADIWSTIHPMMEQVMRSGKAVSFQDLLVPFYRNGRTEDIYWTFSYSPAYDDQESVNGVVVICHETTQTVVATRILEQSRNELQFAIEAAELGTWDYNPLTGKFSANSRLKEWFGLRPDEEIPLSHALDVMRPEDRPRVTEAIARSTDPAIRARYDIEYTIIHPGSGLPRDVRARGRAYFDGDNKAFRFNGTLQDVTEQKKAERAETHARQVIQENEVFLRNTILKAPLAICILKGENFIVDLANDRMFQLWGKTAASMLNKPMFDGIPEARYQGFEELLLRVYRSGEGYSAQNVPVRLERGGVIREEFVDFLFEAQLDTHGAVVGILGVAILVTAQVLAMRHIEEVVASRTADLAAANHRLKLSNDELVQFAYITSHDLQEPIRKAGIFASMLKETFAPTPAAAGYLEKISASLRRMQSLIQDILNYAELGAMAPVFQPVNLQTIVEEATSDYEMLIVQKNATIVAHDLPEIVAIPLQMTQLFSNLISNALKFSRPEVAPVIQITAHSSHDHIGIDVADNGIGMEPHYSQQIFNIFQRLHRQSQYAGNGIGLALVRKIMDNHEGTITVTSAPGAGTTFHLRFPFRPASNSSNNSK